MTIDSPPTLRIDLPQIPSSNHTLVVRPIMSSEREAWDTLMDRHHYLGFRANESLSCPITKQVRPKMGKTILKSIERHHTFMNIR